MERKLLTSDELEALDGISLEDKALIEEAIGNLFDPDEPKACLALRGYLAREFLDSVPNDQLRKELDGDAASFVDGWDWCKEFGIK